MCDLVAQSVIFGLVNGIFNYGSVYLLCGGDNTNRPSYCPNPEDVLYFVVSWIAKQFFGDNTALKILLLTLIAVFGVLFYMSFIGKSENVSLLSLVIMLAVSYLIFWVIEYVSQFIGVQICGPPNMNTNIKIDRYDIKKY